MMIEAPKGTVKLTFDQNIDWSNPVQLSHLKFHYQHHSSFEKWCEDHGVKVPEIVPPTGSLVLVTEDAQFSVNLPYLKFDSDEESIIFALLWQKGCDSI